VTIKFNVAIASYSNPCCATLADFEEDFKRPVKIRRVLAKWTKTRTIQSPRGLVNQIVIWHNVFRQPFASAHLADHVGEDLYPALNAVLLAMGRSMDMVVVDRELFKIVKESLG
jgi:hypothetical protein